jgi:serine/threonine protein kinase
MGSLHDAYELGGVAGHGRTTVVRLGVRRGDASPVALKQLRIDHAQDPEKRARFIQQARRACMLHHEGIETMLDVLEGKDGPVAVAEWLDGRSLERLAIRRRRNDEEWSPQEVTLVARSLLEALRYAHHHPTTFDAQGMLHGGLWPGNVHVDVEGNVKLVDFGLAAVWQEAREPWQDLEALRYLSADHVRHGATAASDLYAVGAIVHELLAGRRFRAEHQTEAEMRAAIDWSEPPERPREDTPAQLERVRRRLLEPVANPRLALEQVLDLCAAIPLGDARKALRTLVRETLRNDSTAPEPDTPPRGIAIGPETPADGIAKARSRSSAAVHLAAGGKDGKDRGMGIELQQVPLGQGPRPPRRRDTQSVPIPVDHEQTAARRPMFLQQTAPPVGEQARNAERERSGDLEASGAKGDRHEGPPKTASGAKGDRHEGPPKTASGAKGDRHEGPPKTASGAQQGDGHEGSPKTTSGDAGPPPLEVAEVDTAPLPVGVAEAAVPEPIDAPDDDAEPLALGVTAEVRLVPRLPEDPYDEDATPLLPIHTNPTVRAFGWLQGPVGWALLGAAVVGIGLPLVARCGDDADQPSPPPVRTTRR